MLAVGAEAVKTDKRYAILISNIYYFTFIFHGYCITEGNPCVYYDSVIAFVNLINVTMIVKVLNLYSHGICMIEVVPTDAQGTQLHILVKQ